MTKRRPSTTMTAAHGGLDSILLHELRSNVQAEYRRRSSARSKSKDVWHVSYRLGFTLTSCRPSSRSFPYLWLTFKQPYGSTTVAVCFSLSLSARISSGCFAKANWPKASRVKQAGRHQSRLIQPAFLPRADPRPESCSVDIPTHEQHGKLQRA